MSASRATCRAIAIADDRVVAVSRERGGLDGLAGPGTRVIDDDGLTVLPAFYDTHNHLMELVHNVASVPVERATDLAGFLALVGDEAKRTPPGSWIQTSNAWHERNLAEKRLPTARELDSVTTAHPVIARRGGHLAVANSRALELGGITRQMPNPPGSLIGHGPDGELNGLLEGEILYRVLRAAPPKPRPEQLANLQRATRAYAAMGLGAIRDPFVRRDDLGLFAEAWRAGALATRCRVMIGVSPGTDPLHQLDAIAAARDLGDDWLRVWGAKIVLDGGVEAAALDAPYANDPSFTGHLNWERDKLVWVVGAAMERGLRVGVHCVGDRAVRQALDAFEDVAAKRDVRGRLALEHAFLADARQRARAVKLGVHVTVQPPLLYALGEQLMELWGAERTKRVMPVKDWLADGALLSGGTDYPVGSYAPMEAIWGFVTRQTRTVGILGADQAIDRYTALKLYTACGAALDGEEARRGTLEPDHLADLVAFRADPMQVELDELRSLRPAFTIIGGRVVYEA
jgi:predicted amidohydrolase YtcJ